MCAMAHVVQGNFRLFLTNLIFALFPPYLTSVKLGKFRHVLFRVAIQLPRSEKHTSEKTVRRTLMKRDISAILKEWPHQPGQVNARMITDNQGEQKVQVRVDLGILQMNADGRPDGEQPFGYPSLLEYFEDKADGVEEPREAGPRGPNVRGARESGEEGVEGASGGESPGAAGSGEELELSAEDCRSLREEAAQFYQRYVACLALEEFDRVVRDTTRNLRVLDLCAKYAAEDQDKQVLEQFRPYIIMVRARALASQAIKENELKAGVLALDEALEGIKKSYEQTGRAKQYEKSEEVRMLRSMREALMPKLPISQKEELKQRLQRALDTENYELAAILRDELKHLKQ